jgi:hypothetical protein
VIRQTFLLFTSAALSCSTGSNGPSAPAGSSDPEAAKIVTADIARFWTAFDQVDAASDTIPLRAYLDAGTVGLRDFTSLRWKNSATLTAMVFPRRAYYASIRANTLATASIEPQVRQIYRALDGMLSDAIFPDVYFCIGGMATGGTTSNSGLLIGTELFSAAPDSPISSLTPWEQAVVRSSDVLPAIVAHELVHYQQRYGGGSTLLGQSLREGSADFVGRLLAHRTINETMESYGRDHEVALWAEFKTQMNGTNVSNWLYNGGTVTATSRPADLGYFIGARIAESYYNARSDKRQALIDILNITNFTAFLAASGYDPR